MSLTTRFRLSVAACLLGLSSHASSAIMFESTFFERWFDDAPGINGTTVVTEYDFDIFGYSLTSTDASDPAVELLSAVINFDTGIFLDSAAGGAGVGVHYLPTLESATNIGNVLSIVPNSSDGDASLSLLFGGFDVGDSITVSADVDDANAVIRGTNGSGSSLDFEGSTIDIEYFDPIANLTRSASFTYGACSPANADACAAAGGELEVSRAPVPAPAPIALLGLGLALLSFRRRK